MASAGAEDGVSFATRTNACARDTLDSPQRGTSAVCAGTDTTAACSASHAAFFAPQYHGDSKGGRTCGAATGSVIRRTAHASITERDPGAAVAASAQRYAGAAVAAATVHSLVRPGGFHRER